MRVLLWVLLLGLGIITWLQNQQPITLTWFGYLQTPVWPLSLWIVAGIAAGIATSWLLQFFYRIGHTTLEDSPKRSYYSPERFSREQSGQGRSPTVSSVSPKTTSEVAFTTSSTSATANFQETFVEEPAITSPTSPSLEPEDEIWNDETTWHRDADAPDAPPETTFSDSSHTAPTQSAARNIEAPQPEPKRTLHSGSIYSYGYRESRKSQPPADASNTEDTIYDADYRVIRPPNPAPSDPVDYTEDSKDWIE